MALIKTLYDHIINWLIGGYLCLSWWQVLLITLILTHITIASVTIFLHRYQAHRSLELHPLLSHFFRFWLWLTTGMVTREWAAIHRKHHAKCETVDDPHSPKIFGINTVLSQGAELYRIEAKNRKTIEKYGHNTPDDWIENHVYSKYQSLGIALMLIINLFLFGILGMSVWAIQMMWIPISAAGIINGIGHYWGYRNYSTKDASTNIFPLGILIGGEELHNNHHTYPTSAKLSNKWYEFDIGWLYIRIFEFIGLAKVKRICSRPILTKIQSASEQTLLAIIANRYEVMSCYSKAFRKILKKELKKMHNPISNNKEYKWLYKEEHEVKLTQEEKGYLSEYMEKSKAVQTMIEMRRDLIALWEHSNLTKEQLIIQLQSWCHRAETSGMQSLIEFSWYLRSITISR